MFVNFDHDFSFEGDFHFLIEGSLDFSLLGIRFFFYFKFLPSHDCATYNDKSIRV